MKTWLRFVVGVAGNFHWSRRPSGVWTLGSSVCALLASGLAAALTSQTITFTAPTNKTFGNPPFTVTATASSGLPVSLSSLTTPVCTVSGNTVTMVAAGTCTIRASQAGDAAYAPAPNVDRSFTVAKATQTITFNAPAPGGKTYGDPPFTVSATASSGLAVSFASGTTAVCTVSGNTVTIVTGGTCTIKASQAGNTNYLAATQVSQSVTVAKASQTITFNAPAPGGKTYGDPPFTVGASASSGLAVSFASSTTAVCTVTGSTVTIKGVGTCTLQASQAGNTSYNAAPSVSQSFTVVKANQIITFALTDKTYGMAPFTVSASASSGLAVSFASLTAAVCTVSVNKVTIKDVGTCTIQASQAGNANYNPASVSQSFTVAKANQTITFNALSYKYFGDPPFTISATASSGLAVVFSSLTTAVCTVSGNTVTLPSPGACMIQAAQPGNAQYNPAPSVTQSFSVQVIPVFTSAPPPNGILGVPYNFTVTATGYPQPQFQLDDPLPTGLTLDRYTGVISGTPSAVGTFAGTIEALNATSSPAPSQAFSIVIGAVASQTISFGPLADRAFGTGPFGLTATASSGLPVSFVSLTPGVCTVAGSIVTLVAGGTCTVQAQQTGNATYLPAPNVNQSFSVTPVSQTITFGTLAGHTMGDAPFAVSATASSGLAVAFASITPGVCTVSGNTVTLVGVGTCTVRASQPGNGSYNAAPSVDQSFTVATGNQTITFGPLTNKTYSDAPFGVSATASSGLTVAFASLTTSVCTVSGSTVTLVAAGTCTVRASQPGNGSYNAAPNVDQSLTVAKANQTITFGPLANKTYGDAPFAVSATASSGLAVAFASLTTGVCAVSGSTVTLVTIGTCTIRASQSGNASCNPAADVDQTFAINQPASRIRYIYDNASRLTTVYDGNGDAAQYVYDAAGNITQINRFAATALSIIQFAPEAGPVGATVTLYGTGFNATPSSNAVRFNGTVASVSSGTTSELVVTVPAAATTGPVGISNGANTATSTRNFSVGQEAVGPTITDFSPTIGTVGTTVTINGTNFDPQPIRDVVRFNATSTVPATAATTTLSAKVPPGTSSGKIKVATQFGTATSAADFFVPPAPFSAADVGTTARIVIDGSVLPVNIATASKIALILFDGLKGQNLGLGLTSLTLSPANASVSFSVYSPSGVSLTSGGCTAYGDGCAANLTSLPTTGTYTVLAQATLGATGSFQTSLSTDLTGTLNLGAPATVNIVRNGQNARYTFSGTAGQQLRLALSNPVPPTLVVGAAVYKPDGIYLTGVSVGGNKTTAFVDLPALPATSTYLVFVEPWSFAAAATASVQILLTEDAGGTLSIDGSASNVVISQPGQIARLTFGGTAGQNLGLGFTNLALSPASSTYASFTVYRPDGTTLTTGSCYTDGSQCAVNLVNLPTTGTYVVTVQPLNNATGSFQAWLSSDLTGTLTIGTGTTINLSRPGQNARYTFSGTVGQQLALTLSNATTTPAGKSIYATVYNPDGTQLGYANISGGATAAGSDLGTLPATGTYLAFVEPWSFAATASVQLKLVPDVAGTLGIDGGPTSVTIDQAGQTARLMFSGMAGQNLGLGFTSSINFNLAVYQPGSAFPSWYGECLANGDQCAINLEHLPTTGIYTVLVQPIGAATGTLQAWLSSDLAGTLTIGIASTINTSRPGQNARYTFSGTAGQQLGLALSNATTAPTGQTIIVSIKNPDGTGLGSWLIVGGSTAPVWSAAAALPATGTYQIFISPDEYGKGAATFAVQLALYEDVTGTLNVNGSGTDVTISYPGQIARLTFNGTAGQNLGLGFTNLTLPPAVLSYATFTVYAPDGSSLTTGRCYTNGDQCAANLANLPLTGTYGVVVQPLDGAAGSFQAWLSTDLAGTLAIGTASTINLTRNGQNARYTFSGTAGQQLFLTLSNPTTTPAGAWVNAELYAPDGTDLGGVVIATGSMVTNGGDLGALPTTGTYVVLVEPWYASKAAATATVQVLITQDPAGTLTVNGSATSTTISQLGQPARLTFSGTAGQNLGLGFTNLVLSPANATLFADVYDPAGDIRWSATCDVNGTNCALNLTNLPTTGTYMAFVQLGGTGSFKAWLSSDLTGTLAIGTASTISISRSGQNARYTFNGTANQTLRFSSASLSTSPAGQLVDFSISAPDGSPLASYSTASATYSYDVPALPATGTYTVFIEPNINGKGAATATLRLTVSNR